MTAAVSALASYSLASSDAVDTSFELRFACPGPGRFVVPRADLVTPLLPRIDFVLPIPFAVDGVDDGQPGVLGEGGGLGVADCRRPVVVGGGGFFTVVDMPGYWQLEGASIARSVCHRKGPAYTRTIQLTA